MGGDASKIAEEAGISKDECKRMIESFKALGPDKDKAISRSTYVRHHGGKDSAGPAFDTYCPKGRMGGREFVLANMALRGQPARPASASSSKSKGKKPSGHTLGGTNEQLSAVEEREKRAAAAEARIQQAAKRGTGGRQGDVTETEEQRKLNNTKQEKIGKIRALLHTLGEDEPFGLASMPPEKLAAYHTHIEQKLKNKRGMSTGRWVEDELRSIDDDFRQDKMNAFGTNEDRVAEHVEELVAFTSSLLLTSSRNATAAGGTRPKCEEFMCTDMSDAKFDEMAGEFKNKQKHIEEITGLMANLSAKVSTINECINACDIDDE